MRDRQSKRLFKAILCIMVSIFGIIFTFGSRGSENAQQEEKNKKTERNTFEYVQEELPKQENKSEDETYTDGRKIKVYFTNTERLDNSSLPFAAHAMLCQEAQKFLDASGFDNAKEIKIREDGFEDNEKMVTFQCDIPGYEERIVVIYKKEKSSLKFETVESERIEKKI